MNKTATTTPGNGQESLHRLVGHPGPREAVRRMYGADAA